MHHVLTFTPPAFAEVLHDVIVKSGQHLRLRCKLASPPTHPFAVTWTKNELCIENDENVSVVKDGCTLSLDLLSTETANTGHYKCIVTCASRRITCSAYVAVIGKKQTSLSSWGNKCRLWQIVGDPSEELTETVQTLRTFCEYYDRMMQTVETSACHPENVSRYSQLIRWEKPLTTFFCWKSRFQPNTALASLTWDFTARWAFKVTGTCHRVIIAVRPFYSFALTLNLWEVVKTLTHYQAMEWIFSPLGVT